MKHNMTAFLALLLTAALLLAGCGSSPAEIKSTIEPLPTGIEAQPAETEAPTEPLSVGRIEGGTYTNTYAGFGCTLDSDWIFYSAEELQELPEMVAGQFDQDAAIQEYLDSSQQLMDMKADNAETMSSINLLYQKVSLSERAAFLGLGEAAFLDALLEEQYDILVTSYAQAGIDVSSMERVTVEFLGQERSALYTVSSAQGVPYYTLQFFDYSRGSYSLVLTLSSLVEDSTSSMLDLFFPVD